MVLGPVKGERRDEGGADASGGRRGKRRNGTGESGRKARGKRGNGTGESGGILTSQVEHIHCAPTGDREMKGGVSEPSSEVVAGVAGVLALRAPRKTEG